MKEVKWMVLGGILIAIMFLLVPSPSQWLKPEKRKYPPFTGLPEPAQFFHDYSTKSFAFELAESLRNDPAWELDTKFGGLRHPNYPFGSGKMEMFVSAQPPDTLTVYVQDADGTRGSFVHDQMNYKETDAVWRAFVDRREKEQAKAK